MNQEKKSNFNYLIFAIIITIMFVGSYRYYQYMIERNFIISVNTICDQQNESCFSSSPDLSYGQNPYKKITLTANYAPKCLEEHNCDSFFCPSILEKSSICEITYCTDDTKEDGEECVGPINKN